MYLLNIVLIGDLETNFECISEAAKNADCFNDISHHPDQGDEQQKENHLVCQEEKKEQFPGEDIVNIVKLQNSNKRNWISKLSLFNATLIQRSCTVRWENAFMCCIVTVFGLAV
ncbi:hypothetical protein HNY73_022614 [Argiope bruennichi]|uniref:Uncharacterized protein n=1 Tax=Argiope bruennichi TaxID=94029 RepID=A0A8T0E3T4_ARGBR|nr:hypothetical protein HNY73_022614 [Argiope bruennichi]